MEKALDKRLDDLEKLYANLSESNSKLWLQMVQLAQTVEKMAKSHDEFVKMVNESEEKASKTLNEIRDNLLFLSTKGKPS
jgi:phage shock protein A